MGFLERFGGMFGSETRRGPSEEELKHQELADIDAQLQTLNGREQSIRENAKIWGGGPADNADLALIAEQKRNLLKRQAELAGIHSETAASAGKAV